MQLEQRGRYFTLYIRIMNRFFDNVTYYLQGLIHLVADRDRSREGDRNGDSLVAHRESTSKDRLTEEEKELKRGRKGNVSQKSSSHRQSTLKKAKVSYKKLHDCEFVIEEELHIIKRRPS